MEIRRIEKEEVVENLEPIYSEGKFVIPFKITKGAFFVGDQKKKEGDIEYARYKGIDYIKDIDEKELFINSSTKYGLHVTDVKEDVEVYQASDKDYTLIVLRHGENSESAFVYDKNQTIIAEIMNYIRSKNRLVGMKVENDRIKLFAESTSGIGEKYYYKLEFPTKKEGGIYFYNLSAL